MTTLRILITSGGGPGVWGLLYALRHLPRRDAIVVVHDPDPFETLGTKLADESVRLPPAADPSYVEELLRYCRRTGVDVLIPVYDGELLAVAERADEFREGSTQVLLPPADIVRLCVNKWQTYERLAGTALLPQHALARSQDETSAAIARLGYPVRVLCVRPVDQTGGRGLHILDADVDDFRTRMFGKPGPVRCTADEFLALRAKGPADFPLIVSEYLEGEELGVDLLADQGRVIEMVVRRKWGPLVHGNPTRIAFRERAGERRWVRHLAAALGLDGLFAIDARYDAEGILKLLEVNARPGAYLGMTCTRIHLLAWAIDRLLGAENADRRTYYAEQPPAAAMRVFADVMTGPGLARPLAIVDENEPGVGYESALSGGAPR